mgnify:CR=1 FL=1
MAADYQRCEGCYDVLPVTQSDKGRPTKAAAAAFLTKLYLYKAYRQDDPTKNEVTSINQDDLNKVIEYSDLLSTPLVVSAWKVTSTTTPS